MPAIEKIEQLAEEFKLIRQDFHRHPELGHQESQTAAKISQFLRNWGYDVHTKIGGTGVVGILKNGSSTKCLSIRADMDALPIQELNRFAHASENNGVMHACGHDGHIAMALLAARYLAETRAFNGRVQFIFQPCEEQDGGANDMIEDGLFERFPTDFIIGSHNWPDLPAGLFGFSDRSLMASCNAFKIHVHGRGAHGAMPNNAIDPLFVALQIANSLQGIITRIKRPIDPAVLSICKLQAGQTYNVIADSALLEGTVRTFSDEITDLIEKHLTQISENVAAAFGATVQVQFIRQVPPVLNDKTCADRVKNAVTELFGAQSVLEQEPVMPSEDFGHYLKKVPGAFFFIGNGNGEHRPDGHGPGPCSLHNPSYDFNDAILPIGASVFAKVVENYLP